MMRITAMNYYNDNLIHYMRVNKLKTRKLEENSRTREKLDNSSKTR